MMFIFLLLFSCNWIDVVNGIGKDVNSYCFKFRLCEDLFGRLFIVEFFVI